MANAETLISHLDNLHALYDKFKFDSSRVSNLDETKVSPGRDKMGRSRQRVLVRREAPPEKRAPTLDYKHCIAIMPVIIAACDVGPALWIFKSYRAAFCSLMGIVMSKR